MMHSHLSSRIFNTPLLVHPGKLDALIAGLGSRLLGSGLDFTPAALQDGLTPEMFSTRRGSRGDAGYVVTDGVAVIYASGGLVHRSRIDADSSYLLGYNELAVQAEAAQADPDVHAVLQVWDSPGGEVAGAFEYADRLFALRGGKPMWSMADSMAASAAYLGGSAFDQVAVSSTGYVGSIGVVMRHVDFSRALDADGITVKHIFAGSRKVDGNPYEPLPAEVQARFQEEIDGLYQMFVDAVVRNRGITAESVRATQAAVYRGESAVSMGLADRVATTDQLISELAAMRSRSYPAGPSARSTANTTGETMSGTTNQAPAGAAANAQVNHTQADIDSARAQGHAAGVEAERARTSAILGHEKAGGQASLALQCVSQGLSAEQSAAILAAAPAAAPAKAAGADFAGAMAAMGNPKVTGIEASAGGGDDEAALAAQILALK